MNEPDLMILRELQRDSDQSLDQISEQVRLSRNAVWKRIRTMEQNGVIASRVVILDAAAFDLNLTVFIQLKTASQSEDWIKRLEPSDVSASFVMEKIVDHTRLPI